MARAGSWPDPMAEAMSKSVFGRKPALARASSGMRALRDDKVLSPVSRVWPFESGFVGDPAHGLTPGVLHAEIWPGIVPDLLVRAVVEETGAIRDQAQVRLMCSRIREMDVGGDLPGLFALPQLNDQQRRVAMHEEGWILGLV